MFLANLATVGDPYHVSGSLDFPLTKNDPPSHVEIVACRPREGALAALIGAASVRTNISSLTSQGHLLTCARSYPCLFLSILKILRIVRIVSFRRVIARILKLLQLRILLRSCFFSSCLFLRFCYRSGLRCARSVSPSFLCVHLGNGGGTHNDDGSRR